MIKPRRKEYLMSQEIILSDPLFNVIFNVKMKGQTTTDDKNHWVLLNRYGFFSFIHISRPLGFIIGKAENNDFYQNHYFMIGCQYRVYSSVIWGLRFNGRVSKLLILSS